MNNRDVTDTLQAQKALRESEERFRIAAQAGRMYAYEWDVASDVVVRSPECVEILGIGAATCATRRELMTKVHPDDQRQCDAFGLTRLNPIGQVIYRVARSDGSFIWVEKTARAFFDEEGRMLRVVGMVADITERKRTEDALRVGEERYRRIVETTNEGIWLLDPRFHTSFVNRQMAGMLGYEPEEMLGRSVFDFYFSEDVERKRHALARRREGLGERFDERLRRKDGAELWVRMAANAVYKSDGEFDGAMAIVSDITEQRRAEEARCESERRFWLIANSAPVMIWMSGVDKLCTFFNKGWLDFTGRSMEEELGEGWSSGVHPDDLKQCLEIYSSAFETRKDFEMEYRLRRFDGEYRWLVDHGVPRFETNGMFRGYIGSCIDITERRQSEEALQSMGGRLIAAHEEERARVARELHDDLSQRLALLELTLDQCRLDMPKHPSNVKEQLHRSVGLVREVSADIHNLSRQLHSSTLDLLSLAVAIRACCREFSKQHDLSISFVELSVPHEIPQGVKLCLFRIVQEALRNVVKHSWAKEAKLELSGNADEIHLCISDQGQGFDPDSVKGKAGLGLISMRERLRLVGGTISIESKPSEGTRINVGIPLPKTSELAPSEQKQQKATV